MYPRESALRFQHNDEEESPLIKQDKPHTYSAKAAYAVTINFIMGVGVLSLPAAFEATGLLLSPIFVLIISGFSMLTINFIFDTSARAEAIAMHNDSLNGGFSTNSIRFELGERKFDMRSLAKIFLGKWGIHYDVALLLFTYGSLWSYSTVFAASLSANLPLTFIFTYTSVCDSTLPLDTPCEYTYWIYIGLFALIVIPLACLDMTDQIWLQAALTTLRFVAVALMIGTALAGMYQTPYLGTPPTPASPPYLAPIELANWGGFGMLFATAIFAQMVHFGAPNIVQPLRNKNRIMRVFGAAFLTTSAIYILLGEILVLYFGSKVKGMVTLNWLGYNGFLPEGTEAAWWAKVIMYILLLFPAFDVISAFPLVAISLGSNALSIIPNAAQHPRYKLIKIAFRLGAAIPPIIAGFFFRDLALIINISGLFGFFLAFITPAILQLASRVQCQAIFQKSDTVYTWKYLGSGVVATIIVVLGTLALGLAIALTVNPNLL